MKNKLLSFLVLSLSMAFLFTSNSLAFGGDRDFNNLMFEDVDKDHEYFDAIYFAYNTGFIEGYSKGNSKAREYRPDNAINRAEFLKLILEGTGKAVQASYEGCFPDVPGDIWFTTYVCQAKEDGIIKGYPDGTFRPDQTINEVEALKILANVMDWEVEEEEGDNWYKPYYEMADAKKIVPKEDVGALMTRGDIAELVFRNTQVEQLDVAYFDPKFNDDLFYTYDIPISGPMAPGGLLGPGGPFGNSGAFAPSSHFVMEEKDHFEILGDEFFENNYCYFSDQGEFQDMVYDALSDMTGVDADDLDLAGYETENFGVMFCYNGIAATDLQLYTKDLRDLYNVSCWADPVFSKSAHGTFDTILCYAAPEYSYSPLPDYSDYDNESGEVNLTLEAQSVDAASASEKSKIEVIVNDENGRPLDDRNIRIYLTGGIDYRQELVVTNAGEGVYIAPFGTLLAGNYKLIAEDVLSQKYVTKEISVSPQVFDHIEIIDVKYPHETGEANKAIIQVTAKDIYDNVLPYSSENVLSAVNSLGPVEVSHDDYGVFTVDVTADTWGVADVSIMKGGVAVGDSVQISFFPIQLGLIKGISEDAGQIAVPIYAFYPEDKGNFGSFDVTFKTDIDEMEFVDIEDPMPFDNFKTPLVEVGTGTIRVWQTANENVASAVSVPVGTLLFNVESVGDGSIYVQDAVLQNAEGEEQGYIEQFMGLVDDAEEAVDEVFEDFWKWWYNIKPVKDVCINAFVFDGSGATVNDVNTDLANANLIFLKIAQSCNCKFILNFIAKKIVELTAADFAAADTNGDGDLDDAEMDNLANNHPADENCIPIYYVPKIDGGDLGWSWEGPPTEGIAMDHHGDNDNRTLAHELAHQLSGGDVKDPGNPPDSTTQGADSAGNLMNYNKTGDNLTADQCALIEKHLP